MKPCGLLLIDKGVGLTSTSVIRKIKVALGTDYIGHLGTLDPFASGLLPVLVGGAARLADRIIGGRKRYLFTIALGAETDTLDPSGRVVAESAVPEDFVARFAAVLSSFVGEIDQVPPQYSALKMDGRPLYEHMRATGHLPRDIESKRRKVTLFSVELVATLEREGRPCLVVRVDCGKGTYVRSLARDMAAAIGTVGFCFDLRREFVDPWSVEDAIPISDGGMFLPEQLFEHLLTPFAMLPQLPVCDVPSECAKLLEAGNPFSMEVSQIQGPFFPDGELFLRSGPTVFLAESSSSPFPGKQMFKPRKKIC